LDRIARNHRSEARQQLASLVGAGGAFDLAEAALWVAAEEYPDLDVEQSLEEVVRFPAPLHSATTGIQNYRLIGTGSQILKRLGVGKMRLMSAPVHFNALSGFNLEVVDFVQP